MEDTEQAAELDEAGMLKFKIIMINMIRALMDKVNSIQEQMDNVSREMKILRGNA